MKEFTLLSTGRKNAGAARPLSVIPWLVLAFCFFLPDPCRAGIEHLGSMYGIFASDIASAGARADGVPEASAAYHNPAALADLAFTALTVNYLFAQPDFQGKRGEKSFSYTQENAVIGLGVGLDLGRFFENDYPVGMGINLLVDENMGRIVTFDHKYRQAGQFIRYGTRSLALFHSLGVRVLKGLNAGLGYSLTYSASVDLIQDVEISGTTEKEQITLIGRPVLAPMGAIQIVSKHLNVGLVYRGEQNALVDPVTGETTARIGGVEVLDYPNAMSFKDGYVPHQFIAAVGLFPGGVLSATLQGEYQLWNRLEPVLYSSPEEKEELDFATHDTIVPRFSATWNIDEEWKLRGGYAFEQSPFSKLGGGYHSVLDNDRHRFASGAGYAGKFKPIRFPLAFDAAFLYYQLVPRKEIAMDGYSLKSHGFLLGGAFSVTVGF